MTAHAATPEQHCFAVRSAGYARQHLAPHATPQQSGVIAQAIGLHLDLQVDLTRGIEAHLLQAGAGLDFLGRGIKQLPCFCAIQELIRSEMGSQCETHPQVAQRFDRKFLLTQEDRRLIARPM